MSYFLYIPLKISPLDTFTEILFKCKCYTARISVLLDEHRPKKQSETVEPGGNLKQNQAPYRLWLASPAPQFKIHSAIPRDSRPNFKKRVVETSLVHYWESGTLEAWSSITGACTNLFILSPRKIFNDLSGSESPTKVETISEDIQAQSDGTEGASPIAVITTSALNYQQAPQTVTIPGTIQIVTSGEALQTVPMAQNSSGAVVQYQQQQQV